uniref:Uncharacterized protein n=1 Tax=Rousettus aegyptiacus TaxID=9407 RepID=A0A7J8JFZ9_ROUAE|nr:hypothetical protein HJG63_010170 [Rousettus aegyptiacus]
MIISRSIHVVANGSISSLLMAELLSFFNPYLVLVLQVTIWLISPQSLSLCLLQSFDLFEEHSLVDSSRRVYMNNTPLHEICLYELLGGCKSQDIFSTYTELFGCFLAVIQKIRCLVFQDFLELFFLLAFMWTISLFNPFVSSLSNFDSPPVVFP